MKSNKYPINAKKYLLIFFLFLGFFGLIQYADATVYYQDTCESYTLNAQAVNPPWCNTACGGDSCPGYFRTSGAVQGSKYLEFSIAANTNNCLYEIGNNQQSLPITSLPGKTIYLGYMVRFDRVGGVDIWHDGVGATSGDKGVEIRGTGMRWVSAHGNGWAGGSASDHHFTTWLGNPSYHLNKENPYCPIVEGEGGTDADSIQLNQG